MMHLHELRFSYMKHDESFSLLPDSYFIIRSRTHFRAEKNNEHISMDVKYDSLLVFPKNWFKNNESAIIFTLWRVCDMQTAKQFYSSFPISCFPIRVRWCLKLYFFIWWANTISIKLDTLNLIPAAKYWLLIYMYYCHHFKKSPLNKKIWRHLVL